MAALSIQVPYPVFYDREGQPLDDGNIYIGVANLDPLTNPLQVYYDEALTITASQPLKTSGGYVYRNGTPTQLYVNATDFSITVNDSKDLFVYSFPEATGIGVGAASIAFTGFKGQVGTLADLADADGSDWIGYTPAGGSAVARSAQDKMRDNVSVKDFGAVGNGVADDTVAFQNAVNYAAPLGALVYVPQGTYLITETISLPFHSKISGVSKTQSGTNFNVNSPGSKIVFAPTTAKSLFTTTGSTTSTGGFRFGYYLEGLYIQGNSTNASGNSIYALEIKNVIYSTFKDIVIEGFRTDIYIIGTINNRFENVHCASAYIYNVLYDGGTSTTDVWTQCTFHYAPTGVEIQGSVLGLRFTDCLFETLDNYGMNLSKESFGIIVTNSYGENVPATANANGAMFRVGYDGTTNVVANKLTIIGGYYGGRNVGNVGYWLDIDYAYGVLISSPYIARYSYLVRTTANTTAGVISFNNGQFLQCSNKFTGPIEPVGVYPASVVNSGSAGQEASFTALNATLSVTTAALFCPVMVGAYWAPNVDNSVFLGLAAQRWKTVYAVNGTINTSDANEKTDIVAVSDIEKRVAIKLKSSMKRYKFKTGERYHFGVLAQDVKAAFESENLIAEEYGVFCSDTWTNEDGTVQTRLGVRYDELFAFIISTL